MNNLIRNLRKEDILRHKTDNKIIIFKNSYIDVTPEMEEITVYRFWDSYWDSYFGIVEDQFKYVILNNYILPKRFENPLYELINE